MTAGRSVLDIRSGLQRLDGGSVFRTELATPGMCGPNSLFVGALGDWTWDAVSAACSTNAYDAREPGGAPVYLSFSYFRVRGSRRFHPLRITFGDRLQVTSRVFGQGSESVLTLHLVRPDAGAPPRDIDPMEFYAGVDEDCLYVENFNRWITRSRPHSNQDLVRSSPVGFEYQHLPTVPSRYSPRRAYAYARDNLAFEHETAPPRVADAPFHIEYQVEASRDLNGVGLLYFASYFAIVDWALLRLWRRLGRGDRSFLRRVVVDQRMCYLGNADADSTLDVSLTRWPGRTDPTDEIVDAVLTDTSTGKALAVSCLHLCGEQEATP
jgi:probable biosynthetic protein (TIGR04098 family)